MLTKETEAFLAGMGIRVSQAKEDPAPAPGLSEAQRAWDRMNHAERQYWRGRFQREGWDSFDCAADFAYANRT